MLTAEQVLDRYFLDSRCRLLELAAMFDRYDVAIQRDGAAPTDDARAKKLRRSLAILAEPHSKPNRAEQLLLLFSD